MSKEKAKQEITLWQPSEYSGSDLLPVAMKTEKVVVKGRENIDMGDIRFPTMYLVQGQSEAMKLHDDARPGTFFIESTREVFKPPVRMMAVHYSKGAALFPKAENPRHKGLKRCISRDGVKGTEYGFCEECRKCLDWVDGQKPLGSQSHNWVMLTHRGPMMLRFANTSYKGGGAILTPWTFSDKDLWAHPVEVSVFSDTKDLGGGQKTTYYYMDMAWLQGEDVPPVYQAAASALHDQVQAAFEAGKLQTEDDADPSTQDPFGS